MKQTNPPCHSVLCCRLDDEDSGESQEVLEDQLTRQLTREYLELIGKLPSLKTECSCLHGRVKLKTVAHTVLSPYAVCL